MTTKRQNTEMRCVARPRLWRAVELLGSVSNHSASTVAFLCRLWQFAFTASYPMRIAAVGI